MDIHLTGQTLIATYIFVCVHNYVPIHNVMGSVFFTVLSATIYVRSCQLHSTLIIQVIFYRLSICILHVSQNNYYFHGQ